MSPLPRGSRRPAARTAVLGQKKWGQFTYVICPHSPEVWRVLLVEVFLLGLLLGCLAALLGRTPGRVLRLFGGLARALLHALGVHAPLLELVLHRVTPFLEAGDRKSTRLKSSHVATSH